MSEKNMFAVDQSFTEERGGSTWLTPPCLEKVAVTEAKYITSRAKGTPGLELTFKDGPSDTALKSIVTFWLTENTIDRVKRDISMIIDRGTTNFAQFEQDSQKINSFESFANLCVEHVNGATLMVLFSGEEVYIPQKDNDGNVIPGQYNIWNKPVLNPYKFCASVGDAEKIAELQTLLDSGKVSIKKAQAPDDMVMDSSASGVGTSGAASVDW